MQTRVSDSFNQKIKTINIMRTLCTEREMIHMLMLVGTFLVIMELKLEEIRTWWNSFVTVQYNLFNIPFLLLLVLRLCCVHMEPTSQFFIFYFFVLCSKHLVERLARTHITALPQFHQIAYNREVLRARLKNSKHVSHSTNLWRWCVFKTWTYYIAIDNDRSLRSSKKRFQIQQMKQR